MAVNLKLAWRRRRVNDVVALSPYLDIDLEVDRPPFVPGIVCERPIYIRRIEQRFVRGREQCRPLVGVVDAGLVCSLAGAVTEGARDVVTHPAETLAMRAAADTELPHGEHVCGVSAARRSGFSYAPRADAQAEQALAPTETGLIAGSLGR